MSFFTNLRADRLVTEIRSSNDPTGAATQKAVARLKDVGPGAIEAVLAALPDADKAATMAFVEVLAGSSARRHSHNSCAPGGRQCARDLGNFLGTDQQPQLSTAPAARSARDTGISKPTVLEVIAAQKARFSVRELLAAAYTQEPTRRRRCFASSARSPKAIAPRADRPRAGQGPDCARAHHHTLARLTHPRCRLRCRDC